MAKTMVILPCTSVFPVGLVRYQVEIVGYVNLVVAHKYDYLRLDEISG